MALSKLPDSTKMMQDLPNSVARRGVEEANVKKYNDTLANYEQQLQTKEEEIGHLKQKFENVPVGDKALIFQEASELQKSLDESINAYKDSKVEIEQLQGVVKEKDVDIQRLNMHTDDLIEANTKLQATVTSLKARLDEALVYVGEMKSVKESMEVMMEMMKTMRNELSELKDRNKALDHENKQLKDHNKEFQDKVVGEIGTLHNRFQSLNVSRKSKKAFKMYKATHMNFVNTDTSRSKSNKQKPRWNPDPRVETDELNHEK